MNELQVLARRLDEAQQPVRPLAQIDPLQRLSLADAYAIQAAVVRRRLDRGERPAGVKMGFTSRAKMAQKGISDLIWGRLTNCMRVEEGDTAAAGRFICPRVEPKLAFVLKSPLDGDATPAQALAAVDAIAPALEIIDSRYEDFRFSLTDVIADNASSSGFVIGHGAIHTSTSVTWAWR